jgi:hypothetical protein
VLIPGLIAESIVAVLSHAMEMGLMLAVVAVCKLAILIEPAKKCKK